MALVKASLQQLKTNSREVFEETSRILIKIADNILKEPTNLKIRTLQKSNTTISKKILSISGGLECLKIMGFEENDGYVTLPPSASLRELESVRNEISKCRDAFLQSPSDESNAFAGLIQRSPPDVPNEVTASTESLSDVSSSSDESGLDLDSARGAIPKVLKQPCNDTSANKMQQPIIPRDVPKVNLPPLTYMFTNRFLRGMELAFHMALAYGDEDLKRRALLLIPKVKLEIAALKRFRDLQEQVKKGLCEDPNISLQDMLLLELLAWFKNDFFSWIDSPDCDYCGGKTSFLQMSEDPALKIHTDRVEMHQCTKCEQLTPFPRYNDVNILLITRRGRCGEWANAFTLMCCAMSWDARHVVDQGDHVWTEVYSYAQERWIHCDPCENACDTPLIYENGWGKKLSYVIAYSTEEVQDVTWRYSSHHKELLARRKHCTERELVDALIKLRNQRQQNLRPARKEFLIKRVLSELVELMLEKTPNHTDSLGRSSGSAAWRLARGEIQENPENSYCWTLAKCDTDMGNVTIRYSAAVDRYEYTLLNGSVKMALKDWHAGTYSSTDVFRKEEKDWKMVYLARREGSQKGSISWKFVLDNPDKVINTIDIKFYHQLYENGRVQVHVEGQNASLDFPADVTQFTTSAFLGCKSVTLTAVLSGGRGEVAWQHAQLFRQSLTNPDHPFSVTFSFKSSK